MAADAGNALNAVQRRARNQHGSSGGAGEALLWIGDPGEAIQYLEEK
jgi:hypothetical protein